MLKQAILFLSLAASMTGCVSYGHQRFVPTPEQSAQMEAESLRVQRAERAERTERRRENREDMMDAANAVRRAYGNRKVYILR